MASSNSNWQHKQVKDPNGLYRQRVERDRTKYTRKKKRKGDQDY